MQHNHTKTKTYLFIDESGDPAFYASGNKCIVGADGFKPLLLIGIVKLINKKTIRNAILEFMNELQNDPLYNTLPCINNPNGILCRFTSWKSTQQTKAPKDSVLGYYVIRRNRFSD